MSDDYTTANVPGRLIMEKDAEITRLRAENERLRAANHVKSNSHRAVTLIGCRECAR